MNSAKWTWATVAYQLSFAYAVALIVNQFGSVLFLGKPIGVWTVIAAILLVGMLYMMFRKNKYTGAVAKSSVDENEKVA